MRHGLRLGASLALMLLAGGVIAAEDLKSGPPVGSNKITPFNPLHCNGDDAGSKLCLV